MMTSSLRIIAGCQRALDDALAAHIGELRASDPLTPINVLVGASLQRPHLANWLATRIGGHANVRFLMPGDLALLLGAPSLVAAGRRALPPLADRVLLGEVSSAHPGYFAPVAGTLGFAEALYRLVRELKGAGYDLADLGPLLEGATDAPEKAVALTDILFAFEARRDIVGSPTRVCYGAGLLTFKYLLCRGSVSSRTRTRSLRNLNGH